MQAAHVRYLRACIRDHLHWCFTADAAAILAHTPVHWCRLSDAAHASAPGIYIPVDRAAGASNPDAWSVPFGRTRLTLWNRLPLPSEDWAPDNPARPLWLRHPSGALMPAWDLAPTLFDLLTLREEADTPTRDAHGRFTGRMSARHAAGLLGAPIFNDTVAALVAAADGIQREGRPADALRRELRLPPALVLSHDLDQLRGNDWWTQVARAARIARPRPRGPRLGNFWHIAANAALPRRHFFDNVAGMLEVERMLGFRSTLYFLNGSGGRYGARSGTGLIPEVAKLAGSDWPLGIHYNYDTYLDSARFRAQREELEGLLHRPMTVGRAHYLRFDPERSWPFLSAQGISVDESLGYPDAVGYRAGIAAPFHPFNPEIGGAHALVAVPLVAMEAELASAGSDAALSRFTSMLTHLDVVGGALSLLFHPGQFHNPEYPETRGLYRRLLDVAHAMGARSLPAPAWLS